VPGSPLMAMFDQWGVPTAKSTLAGMATSKKRLRALQVYVNELMIKTEDAQEGIRAWMEERRPQWKRNNGSAIIETLLRGICPRS
jgi:hypothetical protein